MTAACSKGTGDWGSRYRHCRAVFTTPLIIELKALKRNENYFLGDAFINLFETLTFVKRGVGRSQCKMASLNATKPSLKNMIYWLRRAIFILIPGLNYLPVFLPCFWESQILLSVDIWIYLNPKTQQTDSFRDFWQTSGITCYFQIKQILTIALMRRRKINFQHNRKFGYIVTIDARRFPFFLSNMPTLLSNMRFLGLVFSFLSSTHF